MAENADGHVGECRLSQTCSAPRRRGAIRCTRPAREPVRAAGPSRWRDCHSADALSPSLLKHLLEGEGARSRITVASTARSAWTVRAPTSWMCTAGPASASTSGSTCAQARRADRIGLDRRLGVCVQRSLSVSCMTADSYVCGCVFRCVSVCPKWCARMLRSWRDDVIVKATRRQRPRRRGWVRAAAAMTGLLLPQ